jgi:putative membrane protein
MGHHGIDGFLGTRASIMLDVVFLAMFAIIPVMSWSIWLVRHRRQYALHKRIQLGLGLLLAVAVGLFEIDMRFISGWRDRAEPSPYYAAASDPGPVQTLIFKEWLQLNEVPGWVVTSLGIHLVFATTTALLWIVVIVRALRNFSIPPAPGAHSKAHVFWARLAAWDMLLTALTGWTFYWLAFVA